MIQRVQTLFLLQLIFLSVSLFFIPVQFIVTGNNHINIYFLPIGVMFHSTAGHIAAIAINSLAILIALVTIFLFKKRELQLKLCYALVLFYIVLIGMIAFCPFAEKQENISQIKTNAFGYVICSVCIISAYLAARFVKKDIELLKSTDRIR